MFIINSGDNPGVVLLNYIILDCLSLKISAGMAAEADWRRVDPTQDGTPPFSVFTKPMHKSPQDDREYRRIRLENGLEAVLIHDGKADKAAASLDVAVGHLSDPVSDLGHPHRI